MLHTALGSGNGSKLAREKQISIVQQLFGDLLQPRGKDSQVEDFPADCEMSAAPLE